MLNTRLKCCLATTLSLSVMSFSSLATPVTCGPGPHWIDDCPAGVAVNPFAIKVQVRIPCDAPAPTIVLRGPLVIQREAGVPGVPAAPGAPGDPDHFIATDTLFLKMSGQGVTLRAGRLQGLPPSLGEIHEVASDPELGEFYTDLFYEVDIHPLTTYHAKDVCRVVGVVDRIPPPSEVTMQPIEYPCSNMAVLPLYYGEEEVGCLVTEGLD